MARVLLTGIPTYGLANPTLPLTTALVEAGHHVDYLMPQAFRTSIESCGATLLPYAKFLRGAAVTKPIQALGARRLFDELTREVLNRGNDYDVVVATGLQPQFARIEQGLNPPVVRFSPIFWQNDDTLRELMAQADALPKLVRYGLTTPILRRAASQLIGRALLGNGGRDVIDLLGPQSSSLNLTVSSRFYQPRADDFADNCLYLGPSPTMSAPDPSFPLDRLRNHTGPVIYVTLGTVYNGWVGYFRRIAKAFANTDALVVIAAGNAKVAAKIGPVADNIMVHRFVPQAEVLAHADLCFTHGGFGTITDAILADVPMVVTPIGGDQFFNAYRLLALQAAQVLTPGAASVTQIRQQGEAALATPPTGGLSQLADSFRASGGPKLGASRIAALVS